MLGDTHRCVSCALVKCVRIPMRSQLVHCVRVARLGYRRSPTCAHTNLDVGARGDVGAAVLAVGADGGAQEAQLLAVQLAVGDLQERRASACCGRSTMQTRRELETCMPHVVDEVRPGEARGPALTLRRIMNLPGVRLGLRGHV